MIWPDSLRASSPPWPRSASPDLVRLGDLAAAERIAPSTLTRLINVLESQGYVRREADTGDARAFLVSATDLGRDALERIKEEATSLLADILTRYPPTSSLRWRPRCPALEHLAGLG